MIVAALLAATLIAGWLVRAQTQTAPADPAPRAAEPALPVVVAPAREMVDDVDLDVTGSGLAARSVTLYPAVAGEVAVVGFRAGQRVAAGAVLLRLVDRRERLAVDLAAARLDVARRQLARLESTRGTGAVAGSVIDDADSAVRLAQIELRQTQVALDERMLRAPFSGVVGIAAVEPGDRVGIDTAIGTLDDRRTLQVAFELPESYAARVKAGQALTVASPAFGERQFAGRVALVDSRIDVEARNLRVRAEVPNAQDLLRPGMSFQVRLTLAGARHVAVPELALQWGRDGAYVWVVREGKAVQVPVRSLRRAQDQVMVDGALQAGETVVVEGVQRLRAGRAVRVVGSAAGSSPAASAPGAAAAGTAPAAASAATAAAHSAATSATTSAATAR